MNKIAAGMLLSLLPLSIVYSSAASATSYSPATSLPRAGLITHLDASVGVQNSVHNHSPAVSYWWDQSGYGQNLVATGSPRLISDALNGRPVIELSQESDALRQAKPSNLPLHNNDRTLVVLTAARNTSAQLGYGADGCGKSFGLAQDQQGNTSLAAGCDAPMHTVGTVAPGQWNLHILIMSASQYIHLRNGKLVDSRLPALATDAGAFEILGPGLLPNTAGSSDRHLRVATVLGYNWALGTGDVAAVQRYLGQRWFNNENHYQAPPNLHPLELPKPHIELWQSTGSNNQLEVSWKVSFADGCQAENGWTHASSTSGRQLLSANQNSTSYGLNCWHRTASAAKSLSTETQPVTITWRSVANQHNATTGYRLFLGEQPKNYTTVVKVAPNPSNSHTLELTPGKYYLAMSTIGHEGRESAMSGEIAITVD